ncbi:MAG: glycerophosphodiester phosphodiesterase [Sphaerochaeta sp.]|jgi:glycerophosphoryl diester phosphodiesterase
MRTSSKHWISIITMAASAAIVLLILNSCTTVAIKEVDMGKTKAVAHRGGALLAPENTLEAFQAGIASGADQLELDIHLSKDDVIIVMHDPTLQRTASQSGAIRDYTAAELKQFNAASVHPGHPPLEIPTLKEVLDLVKDTDLELQIEIKVDKDGNGYEGIEERLIALLKEYELIDRSIVISFDFPTLARIQELQPSLRTGALVSRAYMSKIGSKGPKAVAEGIKALQVNYIGINHTYLSPALHQELRNQELGIGAWTVNDEEAMKKIAALGVDFITSDRPDLLVATLRP